jgi:hypothetical protein
MMQLKSHDPNIPPALLLGKARQTRSWSEIEASR